MYKMSRQLLTLGRLCTNHKAVGEMRCLLASPLHQTFGKANHVRSSSNSFYPISEDLYGFTSEQKQLRQTAFQFFQTEVAPKAASIDKNNDFPEMREVLRKCGQLGFLGMTAPAAYGGTEATYMDHVIVAEEISRASASVALSYGAHSNLCINQITKHGTDMQKMKYLPSLCAGELLGALAMSESNAGSDVVSMKTRADRKGDYYILNGSKFWITNGPCADVIVVYVKTNPNSSKPQHGISAFIVEKGMEGFSVSPKLDKLGMRGSDTGELVFTDCKVPAENLLGKEGYGAYILMTGLDIERAVASSLCVGIMQACCDVAFKYAHEREAFGQKIGHFQLIQAKMADMYTKLHSSRSYLYNVVRALDNGLTVSKDCAAVILMSAENATRCALDAIQILGGNGYINDYPAGRLLRDAKLMEIGAGTSEIRRLIIGRTINAEYR
jgi:isovaleryl-CoA dehydrogenase